METAESMECRILSLTSLNDIHEPGPGDPKDALIERLCQKLQVDVQNSISEGFQALDTRLLGYLEGMFNDILAKHEETCQRFADMGMNQKAQELPNEMLSSRRRQARREANSKIVQRARCKTQSETAQLIQRFHTEDLILSDAFIQSSHSDKSPSECSAASCPVLASPAQASSAADGTELSSFTSQHGDELQGKFTMEEIRNSQSKAEEQKRQEENGPCGGEDEARDQAQEQIQRSLPCSVSDEVNFVGLVPKSGSMKTMHGLRTKTESSLVARTAWKSNNEHLPHGKMAAIAGSTTTVECLRRIWAVCGIVTWSSGCHAVWYRRIIMCLIACASILPLLDFVNNHGQLFETIANMSLCACTLLNLIFLRQLGSLVGPYEQPFIDYATAHGFLHEWGLGGMWRLVFTSCLWVIATALTGMSSVTRMMPLRDGCLLTSIHCLWQILAFLELMVDNYCVEFFEQLDCHVAVSSWNSLQAMLRRVAAAVENCFLATQTAVIFAVLCLAGRLVTMTITMTTDSADVDNVATTIRFYVPVLVSAFATVVLFAKAASVTEKCSKLPSLVNSVVLEEDKHIDHERQYLVSYIMHSDAGFYVKGSRFTAAMLVKFCYLLGTIICGLGTTVLTVARKA